MLMLSAGKTAIRKVIAGLWDWEIYGNVDNHVHVQGVIA
jgi:ABC-type uncharacterized transport system fused permease/ATPase subunit